MSEIDPKDFKQALGRFALGVTGWEPPHVVAPRQWKKIPRAQAKSFFKTF